MFANLLDRIDIVLNTTFATAFAAMSTAMAPVLVGALTLVVALYGLSVAFGRDLNFQEFIVLVIRIVVIYLLVTGASFFNAVFYLPLSQAPGNLAVVLAQTAGATDVNSLIDNFIKTGWDAIDTLQSKAGMFNVGAFALALVMMVATLLVGAVSFVVFALAKTVLALSMMLAPIFCTFLAFQATRGWFESWLRMLFQSGLVLVLAAGTMAIIMGLAQNGMAQLDAAATSGNGVGITDCVSYLTLAFVTVILMPQLNYIAASLAAGGASLSYSGANRLARQAKDAVGRSDHEKSRRRWQEDRPVTTAGSLIGAAASMAGAGVKTAKGWREPRPSRGRGRGNAGSRPATAFEITPEYDPRDNSAQALEYRMREDRQKDRDRNRHGRLEDGDR